MPPSDGDFQEYRRLIISELERNDANIQRVHDTVSSIDTKMSGMTQSIKSISDKLDDQTGRNRELEMRVLSLEKDYSVLKTKVVLIGGAFATMISLVVTIVGKWLIK